MFRSITQKVTKRVNTLQGIVRKQTSLESDIQEFLKGIFGSLSQTLVFSASLENGNLIIRSPNKIAANELLFHSGELFRFLKTKNIQYRTLIIR